MATKHLTPFAARRRRVRTSLLANANGRPRLSVHRSQQHIYVQVIDDAAGKTVCFFKPKAKFKVRYATFEFEWPAQLDDGTVWPVSYAVTALTPADLAFLGERIRTAAPAE